MMMHPEITRVLHEDHLRTLQRDARRYVAAFQRKPTVDTREVELRLCRVSDDAQLEQLAELEGRPLPAGSLVLGVVRGRIVAALPLAGGPVFADPFVRTAHILPLLRLRAAQLRGPEPRRGLVPRYVSLIRGSTQA
jgi:hypothetical protein